MLVERVYPDMFPEIHRELLPLLDPHRSEQEWRRIFDPGWRRDEEYVGYLLRSGGEPVAFVGLLFGSIERHGSLERLCNITSWIAKPDHAAESVQLLMPLRQLKDYTLTNMSGEHHVRAVFRRLGFQLLEGGTTIMRPPISPGAFRAPQGVRIASAAHDVRGLLGERDSAIYDDHALFGHHVAADTPSGCAYGIYCMRRRKGFRTALFHYINDVPAFVSALPAFRAHLLRRHGAVILECDSRMVADTPIPASFTIQRAYPRLFRSSRLTAGDVPNLYSEVILLDLE